MFKCSFINRVVTELFTLKEDGSNAELFCVPVDPITNKTFVRNYCGFVRNDIQTIVEMTDLQAAQELIERLQQFPNTGKLEKDYSDFELVEGLRSKYCQTPSELIYYYDSLLEKRDLIARDKKIEEDEKLSIEEKKTLRQKLWESMTSEEKDFYLKKKREDEIQKGLSDDD